MTRMEYLRRVQGLSQTELGKRVLYSRSVLSKLEQKQLDPVHPRLKRALEDYFRTSLECLLDDME